MMLRLPWWVFFVLLGVVAGFRIPFWIVPLIW